MRKKHTFLSITAVCLLLAMILSLAACGGLGGGNSGGGSGGGSGDGGSGGGGSSSEKVYTVKDIKALKDLVNYSASKTDYEPSTKYSYDAGAKKYDGKDASEQWTKLETRIADKTDDVNSGESTSAVIKIFTKSTPDGILGAIANADLTFDEMVRVVDYIAGDEEADVSKYVKEENDTWSGELTTTSNVLASWTEKKNGEGKELNAGWSFFDDWELNDRLKEYAQDKDNNHLKEGTGIKKTANKNYLGTQDIADDNASWQYRSILEKIYKSKDEGGVDLPGAVAARLVTYMLEYATEVVEGMSNDTIANAVALGNASTFSTYFRTPVNDNDPYAALGDYNVLVYLLSFNDMYKLTPYSGLNGLQSCVQLYGFYYQYNQTYYNIVLKDKTRYATQLKYEKLKEFTNVEWLDYVKIQRENYVGSYRYSADFYQTYYTVHFDFQARKEGYEKTVYVIDDAINTRTYTGEMRKAITKSQNGLPGQLAMSDWLWCYGGSDSSMKSYNEANTKYVEGKEQNAEKEYEGKFYYELEELKVVAYLLNKMTDTELSGALYYNCYAYSGSMINEMQGYAKDIVLITDKIKEYSDFTTIPAVENITNKDEQDAYAKGKLAVLKAQAKTDWEEANVDTKAGDAKNQSWKTMRTEIKDAQEWDYMSLEDESTSTYVNVWDKRCAYLEDRVIAKIWSCCNQRVSEADLKACSSGHAANKDGSTPTKEYDANKATSKFASNYEQILMYIATKAEVSFQTPTAGYHGAGVDTTTYTVGYKGTIDKLIADTEVGSDGAKIAYKEKKAMTINLGSSFDKEVVQEEGEDNKWWNLNKEASKDNSFETETYQELDQSSQKATYEYAYTFKGWFLDEECKYRFNPEDDIDFNLKVYAGYDVTKTKK